MHNLSTGRSRSDPGPNFFSPRIDARAALRERVLQKYRQCATSAGGCTHLQYKPIHDRLLDVVPHRSQSVRDSDQ